MIDRADHWQVGYFFPAGNYHKLRAAGVAAMRQNVVALEPRFADNVESLKDWHQFTLLSVASSRCPRWYKRGLLLIGDAAHTMTPAAGSTFSASMMVAPPGRMIPSLKRRKVSSSSTTPAAR